MAANFASCFQISICSFQPEINKTRIAELYFGKKYFIDLKHVNDKIIKFLNEAEVVHYFLNICINLSLNLKMFLNLSLKKEK